MRPSHDNSDNVPLKKIKILVIEDDYQLRNFLKISFEASEFEVLEASRGKEGVALLKSFRPKTVILDLGLPDGDGLDLLPEIRDISDAPVIILSARDQESDVIRGLESGADDYLKKPFSLNELMARIRTHIRRYSQNDLSQKVIEKDGLQIDLRNRRIQRDGLLISLTGTEYDLLLALLESEGRVLTHRQILKKIWGGQNIERYEYLRVYIGHLRAKLEKDPSRPQLILTESGVGYRCVI